LAITGTVGISQTIFLGNFADKGGGFYLYSGDGRIVNALFSRNTSSSAVGMDLYVAPSGTLNVLFSTIAAPSLSAGDALRIASGTVQVLDTIITNHATGLFRVGGSVTQDYNLFYGNTANTFGGSIGGGAHNVIANPLFVDPVLDNYHIQINSSAVNVGVDIGVLVDIDGDSRPSNNGFDIGYDEVTNTLLFLPNISR
jgi:hypothetical protein